MELYEWQANDVTGAVEAIKATGGALLSWGMGSGKTVTGVEIAKRLEAKRVLVIAPLSTRESWDRTAQGQNAPNVQPAHNKNKAGKKALAGLEWGVEGWYVVSHAFMTRSDVSEWEEFDLVICDEIHLVAEKTSKGLKNLLKIQAKGRVALSGTPARNKLENLWGVSRFLWPHLDEAGEVADAKFWRWAALRLEEKTVYTNQRDQWGNPKTVKQFTGEKDPGSLFKEMPFASVHLAREKCCEYHPNGVLASLQEPAVMHETIEMLPEQRRAIRDMETQMVTYLNDHPMVTDIPLTAQLRIRQCILGVPTVTWYEEDGEDKQEVSFAEDCKSPFLDRLREILSEDEEPFVVWTESQKFAEVVVARLNKWGLTSAEYSGKRKAPIAEFGSTYRVLVAIPSALGTGSDGLQQVSNSEVWLSRSLDETVNEQAEARLFRNGQAGQVRRWIFFDDGGISEGRFSDAVQKRLELNKSLRFDTEYEAA